ncbi:hypothetical protein AGR3A_Cc200054 [Agrobacterium tomkonis CFBP 6623]|uniref:Uncharacterized protein n=1 Tax=Agrobacterium tomkonis CFBP 6623 TaxID=1183432 RepID=A0A1S7P941_9HYPH|nr:hypothetical protein AGR3A_Cc200054 [Agrobacterium tomkonis CFBP 6623]
MRNGGKLSLEVFLFRAAHAGACRVEAFRTLLAELHVARLGHEVFDDAVEHDAVISTFRYQFLDAGNVARRNFRKQLDHDLAGRRFHDDGVFRILDLGHDYSPLFGLYCPTLLFADGDLDHPVGVGNFAVAAGATLDLVYSFHAGHDLADHGILTVQERTVGEHDEELRIGGIRILRTGHADHAPCERRLGELSRNIRQVGAAGASALGAETLFHIAVLHVAGLRHETVDDAVEGDVVISALLGQRLDLRHVLGRDFRHQLDDNGTVLQLYGEKFGGGSNGAGGKCAYKHGAGKGKSNEFHRIGSRMWG